MENRGKKGGRSERGGKEKKIPQIRVAATKQKKVKLSPWRIDHRPHEKKKEAYQKQDEDKTGPDDPEAREIAIKDLFRFL